jgi:hypothetical protein
MAEAEEKKSKVRGADRRRAKAEGANVDGTVLAPTQSQVAQQDDEPELKIAAEHLISSRKGVDWVEGVWLDQNGRPAHRQDFALGSNMVDKLMESRLAKEGDKNYCLKERQDAEELAQRMMDVGMFFRCDCRVVNGRNNLSRSRDQVFMDDENTMYVIMYEGGKTMRYVIGGLILLAFFAVIAFPAWPDTAKIYVRDGSRVVLVGMLGMLVPITVLRPIIAGMTGWWLLPNLWEAEEFFDSFRPTWQAPTTKATSSDAIWTIIVASVILGGLYVAMQTEVIDPDAPEPSMTDDEIASHFDDLLETEDIYDPEAVAAAEAAEKAAAEAAAAAAAGEEEGSADEAGGTAEEELPEGVEKWDDEEEDDDMMKEFLEEAQAEQRKLDRKASKHLREEKKPVHGGT